MDKLGDGRAGRRRKRADRDRNGDFAGVEYEQPRDGHGNRDILAHRISGAPWPAVDTRNCDIDSIGFDAIPCIGKPAALKTRRLFQLEPIK
jgi:hypothetical protein